MGFLRYVLIAAKATVVIAAPARLAGWSLRAPTTEVSAMPRNSGGCRRRKQQPHDVLRAIHSRRPTPIRDLDAISNAIQLAHASRKLVAATSQSLAGHRSDMLAPEIPLHGCAIAVEYLLIDVDRIKVRKCGASDCDVYFVDTSNTKRRKF